MLIYLVVLYLFLLFEYIIYKNINLKSQVKLCKIIKHVFDYLYGITIYTNKIYKFNNDNILLISNHVNYLDNYMVMRYLYEYYQDYSIHFIYGYSTELLPIINKFMNDYHVPVKSINENNFEIIIKKLDKVSKKKIIVLFPERKLIVEDNINKSNRYSLKNNISKYENLLCPYSKGYNELKKYFSEIYELTLIYNKSNHISISTQFLDRYNSRYPFTSISSCFFSDLPKSLYININKIDNEKNIYDIWKEKDEIIKQSINNKISYNIICNYKKISVINSFIILYFIYLLL